VVFFVRKHKGKSFLENDADSKHHSVVIAPDVGVPNARALLGAILG
jgi:hypothetical protein